MIKRERYSDGAIAFVAPDPGSDRWHWSVRWPGHDCPNRQCAIPPRKQRFRSGVAPTEGLAGKAADAAHHEGPPPAGEGQRVIG
jgi:hypothetical protein